MAKFVFETALGYTAVALHGETVLALSFGHSTEQAAVRALRSRIAKRMQGDTGSEDARSGENLIERLQRFASGEVTDFDDISIDLSGRTLFQRKVLQACRAIPWGSTRTYGELAEEAGYPGAARAVGSVMSNNRIPLIIPCHRVLAASGLGGFSAPRGVSLKRRLLALEGTAELLAPAG